MTEGQGESSIAPLFQIGATINILKLFQKSVFCERQFLKDVRTVVYKCTKVHLNKILPELILHLF